MSGAFHIPVLLEEAIGFLDVSRPGLYIDGTFGLGGHSLEILKRNPRAELVGVDIDERALAEAGARLRPYAGRVRLFQSDFRYIPDLEIDLTSLRGVLLDLGMSSFQLDDPARGFSFQTEGPLDMRMDFRNRTTAAGIIAKYSEHRLAEIFRAYGELKQATPLARRIVTLRKAAPIETTTALCRIVEDVCRWHPQKGKIHPAAKVFQALRIEVNGELAGLPEFLERMADAAPAGARFVILSFHSLEDRAVKKTFLRLAARDDGKPVFRILTRKPVVPGEDEILRNPRSRSAKLRAGERI
ncbi:MAG: 16S rRNA (cytosine(1402)-N(4))-methyltransferase RsmH [Candidatus Aminicenantes bacterium]|nr:16S rRNA (cytosine(1402)-N(4))-methyltransferase RsmH [Candidatus Aminicenantes bacterium]